MKTLRQVEQYVLYYEPLQRMYVVADKIDYSDWFNSDTKNDLLKLSDEEFINECKQMVR